MIHYTLLQTPLGPMRLAARGGALCGFYFEGERHAPPLEPGWALRPDDPLFAEAARQVREVAGRRRTAFDLPFRLEGTAFQKAVWEVIAAIPYGQTLSYRELAARAGRPAAVRAAGTAAGRNPLSWIVPCHRVVGLNGALTGYAGGLPRKRALLAFEAGEIPFLQVA